MGLFDRNWLSSASDEELEIERENVRLDYCNPDLDDDYREACWDKLKDFDKEIGKRAWGDEEPGYPVHREHGWYLPNDD